MQTARLTRKHSLMFFAVLLIVSLVTQSVQAEDDEDGCANGCQSADPDPSQMSRCVRYACRRRVFRYFIRFGKRAGSGLSPEQTLKSQLMSRLQTYSPEEDGGLGQLETGLGRDQQDSSGSEMAEQLASSWLNPGKQSRESKLLDMLLNAA